jgi:hypothetical protein
VTANRKATQLQQAKEIPKKRFVVFGRLDGALYDQQKAPGG